jgi:hypothetical protein
LVWMRPESFVHPIKPEVVRGPRAGSCAFRYRLRTVSGRELVASVTVTRRAHEFAAAYPSDTDPAVIGAVVSRGMTVVRSHVLHRDRPALDWIVHPDGIVPDLGVA